MLARLIRKSRLTFILWRCPFGILIKRDKWMKCPFTCLEEWMKFFFWQFSLLLQYHEEVDVGFVGSLGVCLTLLLFLGGIQVLVLPRTLILLLLFLTAFVWLAVTLMLLLAVRLRLIGWDLSRSFYLRLALTVFSLILVYATAQVNVVSHRWLFIILAYLCFFIHF